MSYFHASAPRYSRSRARLALLILALALAAVAVPGEAAAAGSRQLSFTETPTGWSVTSGETSEVGTVTATGVNARRIRYSLERSRGFKIGGKTGAVSYTGAERTAATVTLTITARDNKNKATPATIEITVTINQPEVQTEPEGPDIQPAPRREPHTTSGIGSRFDDHEGSGGDKVTLITKNRKPFVKNGSSQRLGSATITANKGVRWRITERGGAAYVRGTTHGTDDQSGSHYHLTYTGKVFNGGYARDITIEAGVDSNENEVLDDSEVSATITIRLCFIGDGS